MHYNNLHYILHGNRWKHFPISRWTRYLITTQYIVINKIMLNGGVEVNPENKKIKDKLIINTIINIVVVYSLQCL